MEAQPEPEHFTKLLLNSKVILEYFTGEHARILVLPKSIDQAKEDLDGHIEDFIFEAAREGDAFRRIWDDLQIQFDQ